MSRGVIVPDESGKSKSELDVRRKKYLKGRLDGKSKRQAALSAGFSEHMANAASAKIETPEYRQAFAAKAALAIPEDKLIQRLAEGLDAEKTEFAKFEGKITDTANCVDFEQRRKYLELAGQWTHRVDATGAQNNVQVNTAIRVIVEHIGRKDQASA